MNTFVPLMGRARTCDHGISGFDATLKIQVTDHAGARKTPSEYPPC
jgi:hypothetical protein